MDEKIEIVSRQTDMSKEDITKQLKLYEGDVEKVIMNYMSPEKKEKKKETQTSNQLRYKLIRDFMDDAAREYLKKK